MYNITGTDQVHRRVIHLHKGVGQSHVSDGESDSVETELAGRIHTTQLERQGERVEREGRERNEHAARYTRQRERR